MNLLRCNLTRHSTVVPKVYFSCGAPRLIYIIGTILMLTSEMPVFRIINRPKSRNLLHMMSGLICTFCS